MRNVGLNQVSRQLGTAIKSVERERLGGESALVQHEELGGEDGGVRALRGGGEFLEQVEQPALLVRRAGGDEGLIGRRVIVDPAIYDDDGPEANPVGLMGSERDGGYAEYVTAPAERVHDVTESPLTDDQLATLPTAYGTALGMIERGRLKKGETALVSGASGGVGLALIQIARARGAKVLAISSARKIDAVREAGAHAVIDRAGDIPGQIRAAAPEGVDVALDVVAGALVNDGLPLLREGGRWVIAGALGGYDVSFDVRRLYLHNAQVIGSAMHTPAQFGLLVELAHQAEIDPVVAAAFPLSHAAQAQEQLARREHVGKIVLHP